MICTIETFISYLLSCIMLDSLETAIVGLTGVKTIKKKTRDTTIAVDFVFFFFYIVDILMLAKRQY